MSTPPAKAVTIQDLARLAGVTKAAVSVVLNRREVGIRVGAEQRAKILALAKELNYTPRASACALSTGRTCHIGFLLSSKICLGLANTYFATVLSGVQQACQERGYNCTVSTYDLSTIKNFIMPKKLRQHSVDGVVITGPVEAKVIKLFQAQQIPFVMVGDTTNFPLQGLLAVAPDMVTNWVTALAHLTRLGHRHLTIPGFFTNDQRFHDLLAQGLDMFKARHPATPLTVDVPSLHETGEDLYQRAFAAGLAWTKVRPQTRPTALISHDQWCIGFMSGVQRGGLACPRDLSILSNNNTPLCQWVNPPISAIDLEPYERGQAATNLLVDLVEKRISLAEAYRHTAASWTPGRLLERDSVGPAPV